jgi:hypothetical protein
MALLVALAAIIVVLAALAGTLRQLAATQRGVVVAAVQDRHHDLLQVGEQLASTWIQRTGDRLVLSETGGGVCVADDLLAIGEERAQLTVWVYDGLSGVPVAAAGSAGVLRGVLPGRWTAVTLPTWTPGSPVPVDMLERTGIPAGTHRFPMPQSTSVVAWSAAGQPLPARPDRPTNQPPAAASLVEVVGFASDGRINRNTAPAWLLAALFSERGQGDLDALLRRREQGQWTDGEDPAGGADLRLVATSDRWHALITVTWNDRRRSWWVDLSGNSAGVRILQRHDADQ